MTPSAHLGPGALPNVLQEHRALSPCARPLLRPTSHFPDGKAGSERGKVYPCRHRTASMLTVMQQPWMWAAQARSRVPFSEGLSYLG